MNLQTTELPNLNLATAIIAEASPALAARIIVTEVDTSVLPATLAIVSVPPEVAK